MKATCFFLFLLLGTTVFAQEKWKDYSDFTVTLEHSNGAISNSKIKISLSPDFEQNNTVNVYYEVYKEQFSKKISFELFIEIVDDIQKIPVFDLIKHRNTYPMDAGLTTLSIRDMHNEISINITRVHAVEEYKEVVYAIRKILNIIDLDLKNLR